MSHPRPIRTPLAVVTGVDPHAQDVALLALTSDLPGVVAVRHRLDPDAQVLTRTVSDATGVLEEAHVQLAHACVACAVREDVIPTLLRLAGERRWSAVVACLPVGAEAGPLAHALGTDPDLARHLRLSSVLAAVGDAVDGLLGDDLLHERGRHTGPDDRRGVAEVACAQVESADHVVLVEGAGDDVAELCRGLARPGALVLRGAAQVDAAAVLRHRHRLSVAAAWCSPGPEPDAYPALPPVSAGSRCWRLDLRSDRAFHPERLLDHVDRLGGGAFRSRGSFWLPTRPHHRLEWAGAGGQLSIGTHSSWGGRSPHTRLVLTGLGALPPHLVAAFEHLLLTPSEARAGRTPWRVDEDGFEPWLGEVRDVA
ncbi:GTP-binding protein [Nocardioides sp. TRM66260-LWL]|uniref:CobW family GTP-binding protein n=1 Tax=Nocardioides sp. TRM66260-LWL TaxID=2874478 RepID=UPI001CC5B3A6|nr:GTP-binding protein [Nocardioides sp. TRM66260-LWL]MBZ5735954.1 GTP-binding protein [Nocardioides sp. TRM66260-LWL]